MADQDQNDKALRALFPTFMLEADYPGFQQEKNALLRRVYAIRDEDEAGRQWSAQHYPHGYTSYHSQDQLYSAPVFKNMVDYLFECAYDFGAKQFWDLDHFELIMTQLFCNINGKDCVHNDHVHPYSQISGVIYLKADAGTSTIHFNDPRTARWMVPAPLKQNLPENALVTTLRPEEGKTFLFPSWLEHGVAQNQIEGERVSMSYNFDLRMKSSK